MRSLNPVALGLARARSEEIMSRIAQALVQAELEAAPLLDPIASMRFLDSLGLLLESVPHAAIRLLERQAEHSNAAVRRSVARVSYLLAKVNFRKAEKILAGLCADPEAPVRSAAAQALSALIAATSNAAPLVERWLTGSPSQREAMERARRRIPAPMGTAPVKRWLTRHGPTPQNLH